MSIEPAHLRYTVPAPVAAPERAGGGPPATRSPASPVPADAIELSIPAVLPPDLLEQVSAARRCVEEMARNNRQLHFRPDEHARRIVIEVCDMAGNVLRTIPPSKALDLMSARTGEEGAWPA